MCKDCVAKKMRDGLAEVVPRLYVYDGRITGCCPDSKSLNHICMKDMDDFEVQEVDSDEEDPSEYDEKEDESDEEIRKEEGLAKRLAERMKIVYNENSEIKLAEIVVEPIDEPEHAMEIDKVRNVNN